LKRDKDGKSYSSIDKEDKSGKPNYQALYFHSKLGTTLREATQKAERGGGRKPEVMLVFELVVTATDTAKRVEA
jgi:hypothetical protein